MLLNEEPLGILSSRKNRFKVYYPSKNHEDLDLIIKMMYKNVFNQ